MAPLLSRLQRLAWRDVLETVEAAAVLCWVAFLLRRKTFLRLLDELHLRDKVPPADTHRTDRAAQLVRWAHRLVPLEPNCLLDSLAAAALVRRQGFSPPLAIGVKLQQGTLQAHAWLGNSEEKSVEDFRLLYRIPGESSGVPGAK